jgi:MFS family permease
MATFAPSVLREEPRYRLLFGGQLLSIVGDRVTFVALPFAVLAIGDLGDLALVTVCATLPFLVVAIPAGSLADRIGRRRAMIGADLARFAIQAAMAALLLTGAAEIWMLAALSALYGTAEAVFGPALVGLIPQTVAAERIQQANALFAGAQNLGMILGPALAGVLIAVAGTGEAIAIDALSFLVSAWFLARLRPRPVTAAESGDDGPHDLLGGLREGWRIVRESGWLPPGIATLCAYTIFALPAIFVLGPALADRELGGGANWAVITTGYGVGAVVGSLIAYRARLSRTLVACFAAMAVASLQGVILASGLGVAAITVLEGLCGVFVSLSFTLWDTTVQEQVPPEATARVSAYDWAAAVGLMPVGLAAAPAIAAAIGLEATMRLGSALGVLAALACLTVPAVRAVRRPAPSADDRP